MKAKCQYSNLIASPTEFHFEIKAGASYNPQRQWLTLGKATYDQDPSWDSTVDSEWIWVTPASGRGERELQVHVKALKMPVGEYQGILTIKSHVTVTPAVIPITLSVKPDLPPEQPPSQQPEPTEPPPSQPPEPTEPPPSQQPEPTEPPPSQPPEQSQWERLWNAFLELLRRIFR